MTKRKLKCQNCDTIIETEDDGIIGYVCEDCWLNAATKNTEE